jgi:hypothetical protein
MVGGIQFALRRNDLQAGEVNDHDKTPALYGSDDHCGVKMYFPRLVRACHSGVPDYHDHGGLTYKNHGVNVGKSDHDHSRCCDLDHRSITGVTNSPRDSAVEIKVRSNSLTAINPDGRMIAIIPPTQQRKRAKIEMIRTMQRES